MSSLYSKESFRSSRKTYPGSYLLDADDPERTSSAAREKSPLRQTKEEFIYKEIKDLRRRLVELEEKVAKHPSAEEGGRPGDVCFSAVRTTFLQASSGGTKVNYDRCLTNKGGAFSQSTGTFRCPQAGMYFFAMHGENACEQATFDLRVDNKPVLSVTQGGENWSTSGNTTIIPLATGQQVYVYLHQGKMSSYDDKPLASFCGFLIN